MGAKAPSRVTSYVVVPADGSPSGIDDDACKLLAGMTTTSAIDWAALEAAARVASGNAYCPYSHFPVGAAVLADDGRIFAACNVENASFGLTMCAERNAIAQAIATGARQIVALAVYTPTPQPVTPCGACRQVLAEFGRAAQVACVGDGVDVVRTTTIDLLPHGFALPPIA